MYTNPTLQRISDELRFLGKYQVSSSQRSDEEFFPGLSRIWNQLPRKEPPKPEIDELTKIKWVPILQKAVNDFNEWYDRRPQYDYNKGRRRRASLDQIVERNIAGVFVNKFKAVITGWNSIPGWRNRRKYCNLTSESVSLSFKDGILSGFQFKSRWRTSGPVNGEINEINAAAKEVVFGIRSNRSEYVPENPIVKIATDLQKFKTDNYGGSKSEPGWF